MTDNGEISSVVKNAKILKFAREELATRTMHISQHYKGSLITASGALHCIRMIENLYTKAEKKRAQNEDVRQMEEQLAHVRATLMKAVRMYDKHQIREAERIAEQLTLSYDPVFLETEENRRDKYHALRNRQNRQKVTWTSNPSSRFVSLMKGDFEGIEAVSEAEQRSCVSKCAWLFAIIGLIVALGFLVTEFWYAQTNPAISSTVTRNEKLNVPVIHLCSKFPFLPAFDNLTQQYAGQPLFALRSYTNSESRETMAYPETKELVYERSLLGNTEFCSQHMQYISKRNIMKALHGETEPTKTCHSCMRVGRKKPISLNAELAKYRTLGAVTLESAISYDMEYCFDPSNVISGWLKANVRSSLEDHWEKLFEKKIITIIDAPSTGYILNNGFDHLKADMSAHLAAEAAVYCNIYFFSGFFFPVEPGSEVRYGFDLSRADPWVRLTDDENFLETQTEVFNPFEEQVSNRAIVLDIVRHAKSSNLNAQVLGVNLYVQDSGSDGAPKPHDFVGALRENHRDVLLLTREDDHEQAKHVRKLITGPLKQFVSLGRFARFNVSVDFATFDTALVSRRPTTSLAEFLTDVFEYVGLFTGVCAYTLIVGPARMYLRVFKPNTRQEAGNVRA